MLGFRVVVDLVHELRRRHHEIRVAAVGLPTREDRIQAQVLAVALAESTGPAAPVEPCDAHPRARRRGGRPGSERIHAPHDLVARDDAGTLRCEVSLHDVKVRAAHAADLDAHADFAGARLRHGAVPEFEGMRLHGAGLLEYPSAHQLEALPGVGPGGAKASPGSLSPT